MRLYLRCNGKIRLGSHAGQWPYGFNGLRGHDTVQGSVKLNWCRNGFVTSDQERQDEEKLTSDNPTNTIWAGALWLDRLLQIRTYTRECMHASGLSETFETGKSKVICCNVHMQWTNTHKHPPTTLYNKETKTLHHFIHDECIITDHVYMRLQRCTIIYSPS